MRGPNKRTAGLARRLRQSDNDAESVLWEELRARRLNDYKFVRQFPIGRYFADFACRERRLVVEVDGSQHADDLRDRHRDAFMVGEGWSILRFWNIDVLKQRNEVLETIVAVLDGRLTDEVTAPDLRFVPAGVSG